MSTDHKRIQAVVEALAAALREALDAFGHQHFDPSGQAGLGCDRCSKQRIARGLARYAMEQARIAGLLPR